jgi:UTP-glucose-1-phosphate uridylyltransferase
VILAAGVGSRYGGFKQIEPVGPNGEIGLDYAVFDALRNGFGKVVFVVREELIEPMQAHFGGKLRGRMEMAFAVQRLDDLPEGAPSVADRSKPWGTGHATWSARSHVDGPFAVINADDFYGARSFAMLGRYLADSAAATDGVLNCAMVAFTLDRTLSRHGYVSRGVCRVDADGYLTDVTEQTHIERDAGSGAIRYLDGEAWHELTGREPVSMNMWGLQTAVLDLIEAQFTRFLAEHGTEPRAEFYLPAAVAEIVRSGHGRVRVLETPDEWVGMTYPEDRPDVQATIRELIAAGVYPASLF